MVDPKNTGKPVENPSSAPPTRASGSQAGNVNTSQTKPGPVAQKAQPRTEETQQQGRAGGVESNEERGRGVPEPRTTADLPQNQTIRKERDDPDPARRSHDKVEEEGVTDTVESEESREYYQRFYDPDTDMEIPIDETTGEPYKPGEVPPGWNRPVGGEYRGVLKDKMDCDAEYAQRVADEAREKAMKERARLSKAVSKRIKREAEETDPAKKGVTDKGGSAPELEGGKKGEGSQGKVGSDFKTAKK